MRRQKDWRITKDMRKNIDVASTNTHTHRLAGWSVESRGVDGKTAGTQLLSHLNK